ncbi:Porphyrin biosynthetic protein [Escherichia coli]|uniref:Porphyrin biosynthetic protein n=1 Tax=Escherichia coli TaxID=562 RepID=A0A376TYH0_ECOLX|nr:Porphyrin biosynthetic protein [Escherichia coli]
MLKVLLLFVLLIAGIVVGPMIAGHQGYVLIQTDNYNIETSVTGLAIILILAMVVLLPLSGYCGGSSAQAHTPVGGLSDVSVAVPVSRPNRRC